MSSEHLLRRHRLEFQTVLAHVTVVFVLLSACNGRDPLSREKKRREFMARQITDIRADQRKTAILQSATCLEELMAAVDCRPKVLAVEICADLSDDDRWRFLKDLPNLEEISVYGSPGADEFMKHIRGIQTVNSLGFQSTWLSDSAMHCAATFPNLRELVVEQGNVTDAGLAALKGHATLEKLELTNVRVSDEGLTALSEIPKLHSLKLYYEPRLGRRLTDAGLKHLKGLGNLKSATLGGGWASEAGAHNLHKALPNCTITWEHGEKQKTWKGKTSSGDSADTGS